ncbi:MAG TPA: PD-(D/E)XK nuclease family protein, partial [Thermoanaerobaculia bacterium]|nr:PD-(D/E)XK nuclease family protein [Thermoanaerobaculia bacterium]
ELLEQEKPSVGSGVVARAAALARVAAAARRALDELGLAPDGDLLARATACLATDPARALPSAAVLVHGFADATGVVADLLEALVRHAAALVVIESPLAPVGDPAAEWRFGLRLRERLGGSAPVERDGTSAPLSELRAFQAFDPDREARAAVALARAAVARLGVPPERVAIVARDLVPYRAALAREIARQGLPASGPLAVRRAPARRARALIELLEQRGETPIGTLLEVGSERLRAVSRLRAWELRLAWTMLGATRLETVSDLAPEGDLRLPLRGPVPAAQGPGVEPAPSRRVEARALAAAIAEVATWRQRLAELDRSAPLAEGIERVRSLVADLTADPDVAGELDRALDRLVEPPLGSFVVEARELTLLLRQAWAEVGVRALGGAGGGVALLGVTEARATSFEHVVLIGLVRDRFPRQVRAEPFLPDALRTRLRDLLPDLPVKAEGHDEERFLFAQLLGSAPTVDLLGPASDRDGRPLSPSVFLEELVRDGRLARVEPAPEPAPPPPLEAARDAALAGGTTQLAQRLGAAIEDAHDLLAAGEPGVAPDRLAAHRLAVLTELEGDPAGPGRARLGPFFGFVGDRREADPRSAEPPVTTLEDLAGCAWRAFLGRVLRLAPLPSEGDEIPALPGRLAGAALHRVLERLAPAERLRAGGRLDEVAAGEPVRVAWPAPGRLTSLVRAQVAEVLAAEGYDPELFSAPLEVRVGGLLEVVRELDWATGERALLAVETSGEARVDLSGSPRRLPFRVDRVELEDDVLLLTDYKTGKPVSRAVQATTRERHLAAQIARGERLQLVAYARSLAPRPALGRLLFVAPDLDDDWRDVRLEPDALDPALERGVLETLYEVWDRGACVPRLLDDKGRDPWSGCASCSVRVACVQGDSGARGRFARWLDAGSQGEAPPAAAARRLLRLGRPQPKRAGAEEAG